MSEVSELIQISVPTKTVALELTDTEKIEIVLRPFKQKYFASAIAIINKYFDQFNSVRQNYLNLRSSIIDRYSAERLKVESDSVELAQEKQNVIATSQQNELDSLDASFNEGMEIAKAILAGGEGVAEDVKTIISMSIYKATAVIELANGTERNKIEPELDDLTWGECAVLLGSVVGLNMDFFNQNSAAMNLMAVLSEDEPKPKPEQKDGEESSADSSVQVTATAK